MIVVFGASGQTGGEVTRQLAAQGVPTRALVHNPEKARMLSGLNVEIAQADLARPKTLEAALRGAQKVYFVVTGSALQMTLIGLLATFRDCVVGAVWRFASKRSEATI